jgi:hypothetical protein
MSKTDAAGRAGPLNPLHALIDQMVVFYKALWKCHHAGTKEARDETLRDWHSLTQPFWKTHRFPDDAVRNIADPVLAWCRNKGCADEPSIAVVESGVGYLIAMARHRACAEATIYANADEAWTQWTKQGDLLELARAAWQELRRLAAVNGEPWNGNQLELVKPNTNTTPAQTDGPDLDGAEAAARRRLETEVRIQRIQNRLEERRRRVLTAIDVLDGRLPSATADNGISENEVEPVLEALLALCRVVRECKFDAGLDDIIGRNGDVAAVTDQTAIYLYRLASADLRERCREMLVRIAKWPMRATGSDKNALSQSGVWDGVRLFFDVIVPTGGGIHIWHPDWIEMQRLKSELSSEKAPPPVAARDARPGSPEAQRQSAPPAPPNRRERSVGEKSVLLKAPAKTPAPLGAVYEKVADAVFEAAGCRHLMLTECSYPYGVQASARALLDSLCAAHQELQQSEIWLRARAPEVWDACHSALDAIAPVQHAFTHIETLPEANLSGYASGANRACPAFDGCSQWPAPLGLGEFANAVQAYFARVPKFDEWAILEELREKTITAADRCDVSPSSGVPDDLTRTNTVAATTLPESHTGPATQDTPGASAPIQPMVSKSAAPTASGTLLTSANPNRQLTPRSEQPIIRTRTEAVNDGECHIRVCGRVWKVCFLGEFGDFPVRGNKCLSWLTKVLVRPNRSSPINELLGDADGRLGFGSRYVGEEETDQEGLLVLKRELDEVNSLLEIGSTHDLEQRKADILQRIQRAHDRRKLTDGDPLKKPHHNVCTQIRKFIRSIQDDMPRLAAHLETSVKLEYPDVGYYPPPNSPAWKC